MKRVLYIVSTLKRTGPTNQLFNIIKYLDRSKYEPYLVTLSPEVADSRWRDFFAIGVNLRTLNLGRLSGMFLARNYLVNQIKSIDPHLIHTQGIRSDSLVSSMDFSIPRIATVRNIPQKDYVMTYGLLKGGLMVIQHKAAMRKLESCIGVSSAVAKNLKDVFRLRNSFAIRNGVDTETYFPVKPMDKVVLRRELGLPENGHIWIVSGHLSQRKDPLFLIEAWKKKMPNDDNNNLVFIGDGPDFEKCNIACKNATNIYICGRVDNVDKYLKASDFFLAPSKAEGLPNAVLEALACGLPVLLSDIEPHKEILSMFSNAGELYKLGSQDSFLYKLEEIIVSDYQAMSDAAIALIARELSAKVMSQKYQSIYSEHIEKNK